MCDIGCNTVKMWKAWDVFYSLSGFEQDVHIFFKKIEIKEIRKSPEWDRKVEYMRRFLIRFVSCDFTFSFKTYRRQKTSKKCRKIDEKKFYKSLQKCTILAAPR